MQIRNSDRAWGAVQQGLHWFIAIAVISQLTVGLIFANLPENDPRGGTLFGVHATLGLVILLVMLARFLWRQTNPVPALPDTLKPYEKRIALATHWAFYALIIGLPIGGYLMVNAHGHAVPFFGIELPKLLPKERIPWGRVFLPARGRRVRADGADPTARRGGTAPRVPAQGQHPAPHDSAPRARDRAGRPQAGSRTALEPIRVPAVIVTHRLPDLDCSCPHGTVQGHLEELDIWQNELRELTIRHGPATTPRERAT